MKRCRPGLFLSLVGNAVILGLCLPIVGIYVYQLWYWKLLIPREFWMAVAGVLLFGGLLFFWIWRVFIAGIPYLEYDEEGVCFHWSRWGWRKVRWEDFSKEVKVETNDYGFVFLVAPNALEKNRKKVPAYSLHKGYREFYAMLQEKGALKGTEFGEEEWVEAAQQAMEQMESQEVTMPEDARGTCCPHCRGRGFLHKEYRFFGKSILISRVCKHCNGKGYFPWDS